MSDDVSAALWSNPKQWCFEDFAPSIITALLMYLVLLYGPTILCYLCSVIKVEKTSSGLLSLKSCT